MCFAMFSACNNLSERIFSGKNEDAEDAIVVYDKYSGGDVVVRFRFGRHFPFFNGLAKHPECIGNPKTIGNVVVLARKPEEIVLMQSFIYAVEKLNVMRYSRYGLSPDSDFGVISFKPNDFDRKLFEIVDNKWGKMYFSVIASPNERFFMIVEFDVKSK